MEPASLDTTKAENRSAGHAAGPRTGSLENPEVLENVPGM